MIHNIDDIPSIIPRLIHDLHAINNSLLAPWQKLDAIRTFVQPCLTYALRAGDPLKKSLSEYRSLLVRVLCEICNLPSRAKQSYFFAAKNAGGLGLQDPDVECDHQAIVQAVCFLASTDTNVSTIAREDLRSFVHQTAQSTPSRHLPLPPVDGGNLRSPQSPCQSPTKRNEIWRDHHRPCRTGFGTPTSPGHRH